MRRKSDHSIRYPKQRAEQITKSLYFQDEIKRLREKWDIPEGGIKTNEESENWHRSLSLQSDRYLDSKEFKEEMDFVSKKRIENNYNAYTYVQHKEDIETLNLKIPINSYKKDINTLRISLKLSDYWSNFIERYLKFNDTYGLWVNNAIVETKFNQKSHEEEVYIRIWEHTGIKDIMNIWPMVESAQKRIRGFKKLYRDSDPRIIERDITIYNLYLSKKSVKEICDHLILTYTEKSGEIDKIYDVSEDAVRKIISRVKIKNL